MKVKIKIGDVGHFADRHNHTLQCVVRGFDNLPWEDDVLLIDYVFPDGRRASGMIGRKDFILDSPKVSSARKILNELKKAIRL